MCHFSERVPEWTGCGHFHQAISGERGLLQQRLFVLLGGSNGMLYVWGIGRDKISASAAATAGPPLLGVVELPVQVSRIPFFYFV